MKLSKAALSIDPLEFANPNSFIHSVVNKVAKVQEECLIHQLNDFISRGLIEVEVIGSQFFRAADSNNIEYREAVRLVLKDKEYIEKLEKENAELKAYKEKILRLLNGEDK